MVEKGWCVAKDQTWHREGCYSLGPSLFLSAVCSVASSLSTSSTPAPTHAQNSDIKAACSFFI